MSRSGALLALVVLAACGAPGPELVRRPLDPPPALVVTDVSVLDVGTGTLAPHRDVVVVGERIAAVVAAGTATPPAGATRLTGSGAVLLPGLIDLHGHVGGTSGPPWQAALPDPDANLRAFLYCGVTTVLDPADVASDAFARRERVRRGELLGPTIYAAGPMVTAPGGHPVPILSALTPWWIRWWLVPRLALQVATPEEARSAVADLTEERPDVVKLAVDHIPGDAPRIRNDVLAAAVDEARRAGIRAVAHIGTLEDALDAARAGVAAWMHAVYKEPVPDGEVPVLAGFGIPMVATLNVFESWALMGQGPRVPTPLERETVPPDVLASFDRVPEGYTSSLLPALEALRRLRGTAPENVRRLRAAGVTILAGSDVQTGVFPGAGLHRELAMLVEAGLTPAEAIRAATLDAARFLANGSPPDRGEVIPGLRADLLLVEGDPTRDTAALARIRAVILAGVPLERVRPET